MNRLFIAFAALLVSVASFGQDTQKLGYADPDYIMSQLPDAKKVETDLQAHYGQLEAQLKAKATDYEKKLKDYQDNAGKWVDAVRADKEAELQNLQGAFQKFQADAEASFTRKQQDLLAPLQAKVGTAIAEVAKENGYAFIMSLNAPANGGKLLLHQDAQFDISKLVLKKLGVTPAAAATPPANKPAVKPN
jgi:outer membrane protein